MGIKQAFVFALLLSTLFYGVLHFNDRAPASSLDKEINYSVSVSEQTRLDWITDIFGAESEVIVVPSYQQMVTNLERLGLDTFTINYIKAHFQDDLYEDAHNGNYFSLTKPARSKYEGYLVLKKDARKQIPPDVFKELQMTALNIGQKPLWIRYESMEDVMQEVSDWKLPPSLDEQVRMRVILYEGRFHMPLSPDLWSALSFEERELISKRIFDNNTWFHKSLKLTFKVSTSEDIESIVKEYSGARNPNILRRFLKRRLDKSLPRPAVFHLSEVLPPFIRKNLETFVTYGGPNCFNSSLCVNEGHHFDQKMTTAGELAEVLEKDYRSMVTTEKPRMGDVLLYYDKHGRLLHAASFINDEIVFTKNGINRYAPYAFQYRSDMENFYFPDGEFRVARMRKKALPSSVSGKRCDELIKQLL